jgi:transposase
MWNNLTDSGDPGIELLHAWVVKDDLRSLLALAGTSADRQQIRTRLDTFYPRAAANSSPEIHRLAATIEAWWPAVEAAITNGYSNARSEGYNRLAKHEGRNAFGFRNPSTKDAAYDGPHPPTPAGVNDREHQPARSSVKSRLGQLEKAAK